MARDPGYLFGVVEAVQRRRSDELREATATVDSNKDVPFVRRILNPAQYPSVQNPDGTVSSHRLATAEIDGKTIVYPTLRYTEDKLIEDHDPGTALTSGNYIAFEDPAAAQRFAEGSWKRIPRNTDSPVED